MFFNINPLNFFIISGLIQNFILAGIIFFRQTDRPLPKRLLGGTLVIVNLHLTYLMVLDTNLDNLFPPSLWIPYSYLSAIGPLIFFYTRSLTDMDFAIKRAGLKHFIPVLVELSLQVDMIIDSIITDRLFYNTPFYFYFTPVVYAWSACSIFYYLKLSRRVIGNHESWVLKNFSNIREITLQWLQKLLTSYRLLWMIWVPFAAAFLLFFRFQLQYLVVVLILYFLMLLLTYLTYWIGLKGLERMNIVFIVQEKVKNENKNYNKIPRQEIDDYILMMNDLMTNGKIYLNEDLSLRDFALQMKAEPNLISFILNNFLGKNFYDYINSFRIDEVKNRLKNPAFKHLSLLGIGLESGFNSKTSFNRVFKRFTGVTPTEYQKSLEE
ncbi:MAG: helix-turn-helix domain-containing protein [Chitinophagaceae bacterium]